MPLRAWPTDRTDLRCPMPDVMCSRLELELCWLIDLWSDAQFICWLLCCSVALLTNEVFIFRLGFWFIDLRSQFFCFSWWIEGHVYWVLSFVFFFENPWVCFTCLPSVGLFFSLDWVCFTICCLGLMLGFFVGLVYYKYIYIYIYIKILVQNFFWAFFFFFCLKVEQIIIFFFIWGCSYFFFKGKQIKKI